MDFAQYSTEKMAVQHLIDNQAVLHTDRVNYRPRMPPILKGIFSIEEGAPTECLTDPEICRQLFPNTFGQPKIKFVSNRGSDSIPSFAGRKLRIGVVFSGGPAPGGHNVLSGLHDFLQRRNLDSELIGFLGGPSGVVSKKYRVITAESLTHYRNLGGFHFLGSGRTKIESEEQLQSSLQNCTDLILDGLVIIGGDDSNTNAAILAEYFLAHRCRTVVIGVPKTIDGDLRNEDIEASFGFDTATKVYASQVANLCLDAISALKAYHFVRVMGRDASHITVEVALQTHPNAVFVSEEIAASGTNGNSPILLTDIVKSIVQMILERAQVGKHYGVILIPEGLVSFVQDMKTLIEELNEVLANQEGSVDPALFDATVLSETCQYLYRVLPEFIKRQLMAERDPHGNVQVAAIETERLLAHMVRESLEELTRTQVYKGKFSFVTHYFGYEGRCAFPSKFDSDYCYTLGATAGALVEYNRTGMIATVKNLIYPAEKWIVGGTPVTSLMNIERRKGKNKPVIKKKLVDLNDAPFKTLEKLRPHWKLVDDYRVPGPIQHEGAAEDAPNFTLLLEAEARDALLPK
jgi:diphosphate-dependent phosphofructokinase